MARIRTIKPEFFIDDDLAKLHPLTRLLFIGLWCLADKSGRLEDKPQKIKIQILPYDKHDVEHELTVLANTGMIIRYFSEGRKYIQVSSFTKHQRVHHTEKESEIPPWNGEITVNEPLKDGGLPEKEIDVFPLLLMERKGKERKGKDKYGDAIMLTKNEHEKLLERFGEEATGRAIELLDQYVMSKGKKYASHYHTLLGWPTKQCMADTLKTAPETRSAAYSDPFDFCPICRARVMKADIKNGKCFECREAKVHGITDLKRNST